MYRLISLVILIVVSLSVWEYYQQRVENPEELSTINVIELAAAAAPVGIHGKIEMDVLAGGKSARYIYLNSETDYRDQRNISIVIPMQLAHNFKAEYGAMPDDYLKFKKIAVTGEAKRVKINFYSNGVKTTKYYYQTQLRISSLDQIAIL